MKLELFVHHSIIDTIDESAKTIKIDISTASSREIYHIRNKMKSKFDEDSSMYETDLLIFNNKGVKE